VSIVVRALLITAAIVWLVDGVLSLIRARKGGK
jgi:hypothetical protein